MDFQNRHERGDLDWYSIDVVRRMVTGNRQETADLSPGYARFVEEHLDEIERQFSDEEMPRTRQELKRLEKMRAKELFG